MPVVYIKNKHYNEILKQGYIPKVYIDELLEKALKTPKDEA